MCDEHFSAKPPQACRQNSPTRNGWFCCSEYFLQRLCSALSCCWEATEEPLIGQCLPSLQPTLRQEVAFGISRVIQVCAVPRMLPEQIPPLRAGELGIFCGTKGWMDGWMLTLLLLQHFHLHQNRWEMGFVSYNKTGLKLSLRLWRKSE